jgi:hypothetical protein
MGQKDNRGIHHTATCAICGKRATIFIDERGHYPPEWNYFCKVTVNAEQSSKYNYTMSGDKVRNPEYTGAAPIRVEYWECDRCYR